MAVQMRFVLGHQFLKSAAKADTDPSKSLTLRLVEDGAIGPSEMALIRSIAEAHVRHHEGDEARALASAPVDPKILDALFAAEMGPLLKESLRTMRPKERLGTTVLSKFSAGLSILSAIQTDPAAGARDSSAGEGKSRTDPPTKVVGATGAKTPGVPDETDEVVAAERLQDERRAERALKIYVDCLTEIRQQTEYRAKAVTRGVSEPRVTALGADREATGKLVRKAASLFEQSRRTLEDLVRRRSANPVILRATGEFFRQAANHWEVEGDAEKSSSLIEQAKRHETTLPVPRTSESTLRVRTRAFTCRCVLDGRRFAADSLVFRGVSLITGARSFNHPPTGRDPADAWGSWLRLRAHGPECTPEALPGAQVWLFKYDLTGEFASLTTPSEVKGRGEVPLPAELQSALFDDHSPHSPSGPGVYLGTTPVEGVHLPRGSWVLVVSMPDRVPVRVPVRTGLVGDTPVEVTLSLPSEIPPRFAQVQEGSFLYQGDAKNPNCEPLQSVWTQDYLIDRSPVTAREYAEFLNERARTDLDFVIRRRSPREMEASGHFWFGPPFQVPTSEFLSLAPQDVRTASKRLPGCAGDWQESWPIVSISWRDAIEYCAWKRGATGWLFALPHEIEWEKAARGVDGRTFPWGNVHLRGACNTISTNREGAMPGSVKDFPADESPYGVFGLGGNTRDMCLNEPGVDFAEERIMRGGHWGSDGLRCHASYRSCAAADHVSPHGGFRLMCLTKIVARPRVGPPDSEIRTPPPVPKRK